MINAEEIGKGENDRIGWKHAVLQAPEEQKQTLPLVSKIQKSRLRELGYGDALDELLSSADQALFLLADSANVGGIGIDVAQSTVERIVSAKKKVWNIDISTIATFDDLPDNVKNNIENSYGEDAAKDVRSLDHNGKVYVIAENNESETDIEQAPFYEIEGYIVIRKLYGNEIVRIMLGDRRNTIPETINMGSIGRPVSNSESRLIHPTD